MRLLGMQEYAGDTVNFKTRTISYKTKQRKRIPKEQWLIFHDTHPPIIPREMFEKAQQRLNRERVPFSERKHEYEDFFRKKCYCSECSRKLIVYIPTGKDGVGYNCKEFVIYKTCKSHHVREMTLRRVFSEQMTILQKALIENPEEVETKLGIAKFPQMQQELCDKLIEKVVVGEFQKCGECNYGRQQIDFYIANIGCVGDLVDVRYRTYSKRVEEAIPKLWKNGRVSIRDICYELEITYCVLKKALKHEDKIFLEILFDIKRKRFLSA
ncbi:MAG: recombinase family protein [Ruminococcus sp.]|nr:recombinase family protein [Ruminococcus sp.]